MTRYPSYSSRRKVLSRPLTIIVRHTRRTMDPHLYITPCLPISSVLFTVFNYFLFAHLFSRSALFVVLSPFLLLFHLRPAADEPQDVVVIGVGNVVRGARLAISKMSKIQFSNFQLNCFFWSKLHSSKPKNQ